jgi:excisionase family DNA binding protein
MSPKKPPPTPPVEPVKPRLLGRPEAATSLGIGMTKMKQLLREGEIEHVVIGRRVLIEPTALDRYVADLERRRGAQTNGNGNGVRARSHTSRSTSGRRQQRSSGK